MNHLAPLLHLGLDLRAELRRRVGDGPEAERVELGLDVRLGDDLGDVALELIDDLLRRAGRRDDAGQRVGLLILGTPASAMVGTSGSAPTRFSAITASARTLPSLAAVIAGGSAVKAIGVWPPMVEVIAGAAPGNGTIAGRD